jgi:predicted nucleic acid-binding protein
MKFIACDTNIYVYCALQTMDDHDPQVIEKLATGLDKGDARLLIPDIVAIELARVEQRSYESIREHIIKLKEQISAIQFQSYLAREKQGIISKLDELLKDREQSRVKAAQYIESLFSSPNSVEIEINTDDWLAAFKRVIRGSKPARQTDHQRGISVDCIIIESIARHLKGHSEDELIICSNNISDFATFDKGTERHYIHPEIQASFCCPIRYYRSLPDLIEQELDVAVDEEAARRFEEIADEGVIEAIIPALDIQEFLQSGDKPLDALTAQLRTRVGRPLAERDVQLRSIALANRCPRCGFVGLDVIERDGAGSAMCERCGWMGDYLL